MPAEGAEGGGVVAAGVEVIGSDLDGGGEMAGGIVVVTFVDEHGAESGMDAGRCADQEAADLGVAGGHGIIHLRNGEGGEVVDGAGGGGGGPGREVVGVDADEIGKGGNALGSRRRKPMAAAKFLASAGV